MWTEKPHPTFMKKIAKKSMKTGQLSMLSTATVKQLEEVNQTGTVTFPHYVINHQGWVCL